MAPSRQSERHEAKRSRILWGMWMVVVPLRFLRLWRKPVGRVGVGGRCCRAGGYLCSCLCSKSGLAALAA
eukprot:9423105-Heterocapsa_arctica.AAC.1